MVQKVRVKPIPEFKKLRVAELTEKCKSAQTILVVSTKSLPASQFQEIKKNLRGKAEVVVAKKSLILRAMDASKKGTLIRFKKTVVADTALMFSDMEAFALASLLIDSQTPAKAKVGDVAPMDIEVEPGPTELMPGPAISELGAVGLKIAVENGKLSIKKGATIVKEGEEINDKVAGVMGKLNILPMRVGFIPLAAYDAENDTIYTEIKIDKKAALEELRSSISKALGFAVNLGYTVKETISFFIGKASREAKVLENLALKDENSVEGSDEKKPEGETTASPEVSAGGSDEKKSDVQSLGSDAAAEKKGEKNG